MLSLDPTSKRFNAGGFTLVELVAVIILLGILTVSVAPKFMGRSGFAEYALRDQIKSTIRFAQQRAMYDHAGACYSATTGPGGVEALRNGVTINPDYSVALLGDYQGIGLSALTLYFDGNGSAYTGNCPPGAGAAALGSVTPITISGDETVSLNVYPTGYVQ